VHVAAFIRTASNGNATRNTTIKACANATEIRDLAIGTSLIKRKFVINSGICQTLKRHPIGEGRQFRGALSPIPWRQSLGWR